MSFTKQEINEVWDKYNQAVKDLENFEFQTTKTKKEIVERLRESILILVENGKIPIEKQQLSSYVWNLLIERGITYHYNTFITIFKEGEKRNYSQSSATLLLGEHEHEFIKDGNIERCQCKVIRHNGIIYDQQKPPKIKPKISLDKEKIPRDFTEQELYLMRTVSNLSQLAKLAESLINKAEDPKIKEALNESLCDIKKLTLEAKDHEAEIIAIGKELDYRQRIGKFEKLKAVLLDKCEYNTAKVAKLLQITPKHMAANIIRKEFPELHENTRNWFKVIEFKVGDKTVIVDIASYFDRQYVRGQLGLDIKKPFLIHYTAK